jgi:integrase
MANKSNTTFGFMLANHPNRFGFYPVMLRITRDRKTKRVKTELEVKKVDWNQKAKSYKHFRDRFDNAEVYNDMLLGILRKYKESYKDLKEEGNASAANIISKVKSGEISESFLQYAKDRTQEIYNAGGIRNWKKYNGFCNKLEDFMKKIKTRDLTFAELTPSLLSKFDTYLHKLPNERHPELLLHPNTIALNFNIFKTILNRAIEIDDLMKPENNPFLKFKYSGVKTQKEKLDASELDAIKQLDLQEGSLIWNCRNYFFFSFYCAGIRVGDLVQLRWCNITSEGRLNYQMGKNHKARDLKLVPEALDIVKYYWNDSAKLSDYIFPLLDMRTTWAKYSTQEEKDAMPSDMKKAMFQVIGSKNALINKELEKIRIAARIEKKISFHIARHSFARAAKAAGIDNLEVKALLAHTNLSTTEKYMGSFDTSKNDEALETIFKKEESDVDIEATLLKQLEGVSPELLQKVLGRLSIK